MSAVDDVDLTVHDMCCSLSLPDTTSEDNNIEQTSIMPATTSQGGPPTARLTTNAKDSGPPPPKEPQTASSHPAMRNPRGDPDNVGDEEPKTSSSSPATSARSVADPSGVDDFGSAADEVKVFKDEDEVDGSTSESHQAELLAEKSSLITESEQVQFRVCNFIFLIILTSFTFDRKILTPLVLTVLRIVIEV